MASQLAKGLNGSECVIRIGDRVLAYGSSINFNEDFANQVIGAISSSGPLALEPVQYSGGSGSFTITRYAVQDAPALAPGVSNPQLAANATDAKDNSFLSRNAFSPARILMDNTFDIIIESKGGPGKSATVEYKLVDCLLTNYSIGFNPGGISSENVSFECRLVVDPGAEPNKENNNLL